MPPRIAVCQMAVEDLDVQTNLSRVEARIEGLPDDVDVALFPEQMLTGFVPDDRIGEAALSHDGKTVTELHETAGDEDIALVVGFVERQGESLFNTIGYLPPGSSPAFYRKRHLWAGERTVLEPGGKVVTVETPVGEAGILTCYDLNFVGESASLVREEISALFVVGAWPGVYSENWTLLIRARALDGVRWAVGANRTGRRAIPDARTVVYGGRSMIARPDGGIHMSLDRGEWDLVTYLDPDVLAHHRDLIGVFSDPD